MKTGTKKLLAAIAVLVILIAIFCTVYRQFLRQPQSGEKSITITIIDDTGAEGTYELDTVAGYLLEALETVADIDGEEGPYGYTLYTVNGLTADFNAGNAYWAIYVNGEYGQLGISQQPVADGDAFTIAYETYAA